MSTNVFSAVNDNVIFFPGKSINFAHVTAITSKGGQITSDRCVLRARTGDAENSVANIMGLLPLYLNQEESVTVTLNVAFAQPKEGLLQLLGMGDSEVGIFVGFDGTDFGMLRRADGRRQHWVIKVLAGSTSAGVVTLNILGQQLSADVAEGADPLAIMYALAGMPGLRDLNVQVYACFDRVTLYTHEARDFSGFDDAVIDFGTTGAAGEIAMYIAGRAPVDVWTYGPDFNCIGASLLPDLHMQSMNVFQFSFSRWSTGPVAFAVLDPLNGSMTPLHQYFPARDETTFNTSLPYHPYVLLQNLDCAGESELQTSMAAISSGTPATATNRTPFSTTFVATDFTVTADRDTVVGLITCPRVSKFERNRLTACVERINVNSTNPRSIRVKVAVGGVVSKSTASQLHLPWSCLRHATPSAADTFISGGIEVSSMYLRESSTDRSVDFSALWLVPGTSLTISVCAVEDPVTCSLDAQAFWQEI